MDYISVIPLVILCEIANRLSIFDYIKLSSSSKKVRKCLIRDNWQFVKFINLYRDSDYFSYECFILNNSLIIRWARELGYCKKRTSEWCRARIVLNQPIDKFIDFHQFRLVCKYGTKEQIIYYYERYFVNSGSNMVIWNMIVLGRIDAAIISKELIYYFPKLYEFIESGYQRQYDTWFIRKLIIRLELIDIWYKHVEYLKKNGIKILVSNINKMSLNMFKAILKTNSNNHVTDIDYIVNESNYEIINYMLNEKIKFRLKYELIHFKSTYDLLNNTRIKFQVNPRDIRRWNIYN